MEIDTTQAENLSLAAHINCEVEFSTLKRQLLVFGGPAALVAGVAMEFVPSFLPVYGAVLGLVGFFLVIFGLWMPIHGLFGYAEVWRFDDQAITRVRRNWVWKGERHWPYSAVKNVRFKDRDEHVLPEMLIQGKGWLPLPEQVDQDTAERLKTLIGNYKRAALSNDAG